MRDDTTAVLERDGGNLKALARRAVAFEALDANGSGKVTVHELAPMMRRARHVLGWQTAEETAEGHH